MSSGEGEGTEGTFAAARRSGVVPDAAEGRRATRDPTRAVSSASSVRRGPRDAPGTRAVRGARAEVASTSRGAGREAPASSPASSPAIARARRDGDLREPQVRSVARLGICARVAGGRDRRGGCARGGGARGGGVRVGYGASCGRRFVEGRGRRTRGGRGGARVSNAPRGGEQPEPRADVGVRARSIVDRARASRSRADPERTFAPRGPGVRDLPAPASLAVLSRGARARAEVASPPLGRWVPSPTAQTKTPSFQKVVLETLFPIPGRYLRGWRAKSFSPTENSGEGVEQEDRWPRFLPERGHTWRIDHSYKIGFGSRSRRKRAIECV